MIEFKIEYLIFHFQVLLSNLKKSIKFSFEPTSIDFQKES